MKTTSQVEIEPNLHAHRCENCFRNGVTTVWVHDNSHAGDMDCVKVAASHTCPKCGANEWQKWFIPVGKLPEQKRQQQFAQFVSLQQLETVLNVAFWLVAVLAITYIFYVYVNRKNGGGGTGAM